MSLPLNNSLKKQQGATLFTTLVFLVLMTLVSVSATKISIRDVMISGNEQQQSLLFQQTENQLKPMVNINQLIQAYGPTGFQPNVPNSTNKYKLGSSTAYTEKVITDLPVLYPCERNGVAASIGMGAPPCDLFDFQVRSNSQTSGARDKHHRGAGKMIPNVKSSGSLL